MGSWWDDDAARWGRDNRWSFYKSRRDSGFRLGMGLFFSFGFFPKVSFLTRSETRILIHHYSMDLDPTPTPSRSASQSVFHPISSPLPNDPCHSSLSRHVTSRNVLPRPSPCLPHLLTPFYAFLLDDYFFLIDNLIVIVYDVTISVRFHLFNSSFPVLRFCGTSLLYTICFIQRVPLVHPTASFNQPCALLIAPL